MPVETPNIGIPPTLTYGNLGPESIYQHALTSNVDSDSTDGGTTARGHTAGGQRRSARPAARKSATATRRQVRDQDAGLSDEEEGEGNGCATQRHSEETRLQRMESEQRRHDELRNGYARLKSALPVSNQKSSKISLLNHAITYIRQLETGQNSLETQLQNTERELDRQRGINSSCPEPHPHPKIPTLSKTPKPDTSQPLPTPASTLRHNPTASPSIHPTKQCQPRRSRDPPRNRHLTATPHQSQKVTPCDQARKQQTGLKDPALRKDRRGRPKKLISSSSANGSSQKGNR
ncbi:hypothetical protein JB92DRAFT_2072542 [Gautieria morchelliformis]|nr:hypothetical protein JB92DRAFT_2072542 [Gautieria morchelliformis]